MPGSLAGTLFDLSGRVALITSLTRGIGRATAEELAKHGSLIVISGEDAQACAVAQSEMQAAGYDATALLAQRKNPDFSGFELEPTSGFEPLTC